MVDLIEQVPDWTAPTGTVDDMPDGPPYPGGMEAWKVHDESPETSYLDQVNDDGTYLFPERRADWLAGRFAFVGIVARAPCPCCGAWQYSPGVWGIEDDSREEYFREIADEEAVILALDMER